MDQGQRSPTTQCGSSQIGRRPRTHRYFGRCAKPKSARGPPSRPEPATGSANAGQPPSSPSRISPQWDDLCRILSRDLTCTNKPILSSGHAMCMFFASISTRSRSRPLAHSALPKCHCIWLLADCRLSWGFASFRRGGFSCRGPPHTHQFRMRAISHQPEFHYRCEINASVQKEVEVLTLRVRPTPGPR